MTEAGRFVNPAPLPLKAPTNTLLGLLNEFAWFCIGTLVLNWLSATSPVKVAAETLVNPAPLPAKFKAERDVTETGTLKMAALVEKVTVLLVAL